MRIRETIAPLTAAALLTGCGGHQEKTAAENIKPLPAPATTTEPVGPVLDPEKAMIDELNDFRNKVIKSHKVAEVLMGACVAWGNDSGGITVTLNPGIGSVYTNGKNRDFFIFSTHDSKYKPDWGPLNGPEIDSLDTMTLIFKPKVIPRGSIINRKVSATEQIGHHGHRFYRDLQTGAPVMDTALARGPFSEKRVGDLCDSLREDEPDTSDSNKI